MFICVLWNVKLGIAFARGIFLHDYPRILLPVKASKARSPVYHKIF
jgi:hypothetical protein